MSPSQLDKDTILRLSRASGSPITEEAAEKLAREYAGIADDSRAMYEFDLTANVPADIFEAGWQ